MNIRIFGAIMVVLGCSGFGFLLAASHRWETKCLQQLLAALDYMQCELQYKMTPLPDLCRQTAAYSRGMIKNVFMLLANGLEDRISSDVAGCMETVIKKNDIINPCN